MANVKISALPAATSVAAADVLPIVQSSTTKKATFTDVAGAVGGVRVYASAAARNSAIASPTEGMCVYLTDEDTLQIYTGSAWVAVGATKSVSGVSDGLVYVTSTTFSTQQAAVNLDNIFTSAYAIYHITIQFVNSSDAQNMYLQFREGGTTNTTANYFSSQLVSTHTGSGPTVIAQNAATFFNIGGAGNYMNHNVLTVVNPQKATRATLSWQNFMNGASYAQQYVGGGVIAATNQFDGIRVFTSSGTITGTIRVYGQREA